MRIELKDAIPGMILDTKIMDRDTILINKGQELTMSLIARLKRFGITQIDIVDTKNFAQQNNTKTIDYTVSQGLYDDIKKSLMANNIVQIKEVTETMVNGILKSVTPDGNFSNLKYDLQTFNDLNSLNHSVRTAIFSVILAHLYNESLRKQTVGSTLTERLVNVNDVAMAALMHDKGRNNYNSEISSQVKEIVNNSAFIEKFPGLINMPTDQYDDRYTSVYSFCAVHKLPELSENAKFMILYSSETENNMGPLKAIDFSSSDRNISLGAKIIHICSLYDNFLAHLYHTGESFENIIAILGQTISAGTVNKDLANLFLENVPIYPIGARLELSNGEQAEVIKSFTGYTYTTRPMVKVLSTGEILDLRLETNITINRVCKNDASYEQIVEDQVNEIRGRKM